MEGERDRGQFRRKLALERSSVWSDNHADYAPRFDRKESEVSPSTIIPNVMSGSMRSNIAPWEDQDPDDDNGPPLLSSSHHLSAATRANAAWAENSRPAHMPSSIFDDSSFNDSAENLEQISPGFAPGNGMILPTAVDHRRPSVASATTVSSTGSKSSRRGRVHRKLQGIFGEEFPGLEDANSRQNSETSSVQGGGLFSFLPGVGPRDRNNSMNDALRRSRPPSPSFSSRPRTPAPAPSSEVTPWVYQDAEVSNVSGDFKRIMIGEE